MVEAQLIGLMGNQLFQYAVCRSVAERNGYNFFINSYIWLGHDLLDCDLGIRDGNPQFTFNDIESQKFNPEVFNVADFTHLYGFFQSPKYFNREDVKKWFKLKPNEEAIAFQKEYNRDNYGYIHIRGGDARMNPQSILPLEYYQKAQKILLDINSDLKFVVFTDDKEFAHQYFPDLPIFSHSMETDFCILNSGKYIISPISTFCWWASYLQDDNVVIAPQGWYLYGIDKEKFCPEDIFTDKFIWIGK